MERYHLITVDEYKVVYDYWVGGFCALQSSSRYFQETEHIIWRAGGVPYFALCLAGEVWGQGSPHYVEDSRILRPQREVPLVTVEDSDIDR